MAQLTSRDYERMLDLVVAVLENDDPDALWHLVAGHLHEAFGCNTVLFAGVDLAAQAGRAEGWAPDRISHAVEDLIDRRIRQRHPLLPYLTAGERRPVTMSQICDRWRHSQWRSEAFRDFGTTQQLGLPMPGGENALRTVVLGRKGDFTERELAFAARIQPLLAGVDSHVRELRRLRDAAGRGPGAVDADGHGLTPREFTVLGLLAEGLTADVIGRRLTISRHTVNRHLEKIYRKLGTNNRVSTVSLARRTGLVV
ncbi:LuxR C-terminal-related transcriptional regulator [Streptomyces netropsis]|uniref:helix-turn-helix transcriptional regulator n=1 Tax=Streptomyces netropsis TaxID=55404 RepID=UPI0030D3BBA0